MRQRRADRYSACGLIPQTGRCWFQSMEGDEHETCSCGLPMSAYSAPTPTNREKLSAESTSPQRIDTPQCATEPCMLLAKVLTSDSTTGSMQRVDDCPVAVLGMEEGIMAITLNYTIVPA